MNIHDCVRECSSHWLTGVGNPTCNLQLLTVTEKHQHPQSRNTDSNRTTSQRNSKLASGSNTKQLTDTMDPKGCGTSAKQVPTEPIQPKPPENENASSSEEPQEHWAIPSIKPKRKRQKETRERTRNQKQITQSQSQVEPNTPVPSTASDSSLDTPNTTKRVKHQLQYSPIKNVSEQTATQTPSSPKLPKLLIEITNLPTTYSTKTMCEALKAYNLQIIDVRLNRARFVIATREQNAIEILTTNIDKFPPGTTVRCITQNILPTTTRTGPNRTFSCVAKGLELDITDEDVQTALKEQGINFRNCWRIRSRSTNELTTFYRIISDDIKSIELLITQGLRMFFRKFRVEEARPPPPIPLQCGKCLGYNHDAQDCKRTVKCTRCAGNHHVGVCTARETDQKCANCGGNHDPRKSKCPARPTGEQILKTAPLQLVIPIEDRPPTSDNGPIQTSIENIIILQVAALINILPDRREDIVKTYTQLSKQLFNKILSINYSGNAAVINFKPVNPTYSEATR